MENDKKKALILTTGGSKEPLIESIKKLEPDHICFVHSVDTKDVALEVSKIYDHKYLSNEREFHNIDDPQDMVSVYDKLKDIIYDFKNRGFDIYLDFTGGTKSMVAGAIFASFGQNIEYSYVGADSIFGRDKDGVGIVKSGHEVFYPQEDPFELYAIEELKKSKEFFNKYQFPAAIENLKIAKDKILDDNLRDEVKFYRGITEFYEQWDKFKDMKVSRLSNELKNHPYVIDLLNSHNPGFINQINKNIEFLNKKYSKDQAIEDRIVYYLPDLLNNAKRRIEEGKYDDAVARLYRANELIAQISLTNIGIMDHEKLDKYKEFKINKDSLEILNIKGEAMDIIINNNPIVFYDYTKDTVKLASNNSYQLIEKIEDELYLDSNLGREYENRKIKYQINTRNNSILAHGLNPIKEKKANDLFNLIVDFSKILIPNIEEEMKLAEFPKFDYI